MARSVGDYENGFTMLPGETLESLLQRYAAVARRTAEIGIRVAMGAQRSAIQRMVVGEGLLLGAIGAAIGGVIAFSVARLLTTWLFGVAPADPATFAASTALLLAVTLLASYVPARRASRIDPLVALRHE